MGNDKDIITGVGKKDLLDLLGAAKVFMNEWADYRSGFKPYSDLMSAVEKVETKWLGKEKLDG